MKKLLALSALALVSTGAFSQAYPTIKGEALSGATFEAMGEGYEIPFIGEYQDKPCQGTLAVHWKVNAGRQVRATGQLQSLMCDMKPMKTYGYVVGEDGMHGFPMQCAMDAHHNCVAASFGEGAKFKLVLRPMPQQQ